MTDGDAWRRAALAGIAELGRGESEDLDDVPADVDRIIDEAEAKASGLGHAGPADDFPGR